METNKITLCIPRKEICYFQWIMESYDGMANVRTIDPADGKIEVSVVPDCRKEILSLIKYLKEEENIHVSKERHI